MTHSEGWTAVPTWVIRESDLTVTELVVLLVLLSRANASGLCWPSHKAIAAEARCSRRTAQRALESLRDKGFISWTNRFDERGDLASSMYRTHVEQPLKGSRHSDATPASERRRGSATVAQGTRSSELDPPQAGHEYEPNARRALEALRAERHLPVDVDELLAIAYEAGHGDPWAGYLATKDATAAGLTGVRDVAAVLRTRLGLARKERA